MEENQEVTLALIGQKVDALDKKVDEYIKKMDKKIFFYDKMQVEFGIFKWVAGLCASAFIVQIILAISKHFFKGG